MVRLALCQLPTPLSYPLHEIAISLIVKYCKLQTQTSLGSDASSSWAISIASLAMALRSQLQAAMFDPIDTFCYADSSKPLWIDSSQHTSTPHMTVC